MEQQVLWSNLLGFALGLLLALAALGSWLASRWRRLRIELEQAAELERVRLSYELDGYRQRAAQLAVQIEAEQSTLEALRSRLTASEALRAALSERLRCAEAERNALQQRLDQARAELAAAGVSRAQIEAQARVQAQAAEEKLALVAESEQRLRESFENLAQRILEERAERLREQGSAQFGQLLDPLREQLRGFHDALKTMHEAGQRERIVLGEQIGALRALNQQISEDALRLTRALKGDTQLQGVWGELVLERVLEASGLEAGREYELQQAMRDAEGGRARPDAVVRLPEQRALVIDAKASLQAWERLVAAEDPAAIEQARRELLASLRRHVDGLSARRYEALPGLASLDFVLMFVPMEAAFVEALRADPGFHDYALKRNVALASPSTLLATLRTVAHLWRLERQNENAKEIARRGALLHDNLALLAEELLALGQHLDRAQQARGSALRRLTEGGKGSVLKQVQSLAAMGAPVHKRLPEDLLAEVDGEGIQAELIGVESPACPDGLGAAPQAEAQR